MYIQKFTDPIIPDLSTKQETIWGPGVTSDGLSIANPRPAKALLADSGININYISSGDYLSGGQAYHLYLTGVASGVDSSMQWAKWCLVKHGDPAPTLGLDLIGLGQVAYCFPPGDDDNHYDLYAFRAPGVLGLSVGVIGGQVK
jgi:hypothetical protein